MRALRLPARYAAWMLGPLALLAGWVAWHLAAGGERGARRPISDQLFVSDAKLRRTVLAFDAGSLDAELPVVGGEGLLVRLSLDAEALRLRLERRNREWLKTRRADASVQIGDGPAMPATVRLRGETTLRWGERLNFHVELLRPQPFEGGVSLGRFFLMAMGDDPHQIVSMCGYRIFRDLGLYPLRFQYVRVVLNGEPQGAYLLLEPPRQGLRRIYPDLVGLYRRKAKGFVRVEWQQAVPRVDASINAVRDLRWRGELGDPVAAYAPHLDVAAYLRYLAASSVLLNEDMQAELFFYERRSDPARPAPLELMAWDPEDLGSDEEKPDAVADPLIFSGRDRLDFQIHREPALRRRYVEVLRDLLAHRLGPDTLATTVREVRALRDSLDDGRPRPVQEADRLARAAFAERLAARLLARHAELSGAIDRDEPPPPP